MGWASAHPACEWRSVRLQIGEWRIIRRRAGRTDFARFQISLVRTSVMDLPPRCGPSESSVGSSPFSSPHLEVLATPVWPSLCLERVGEKTGCHGANGGNAWDCRNDGELADLVETPPPGASQRMAGRCPRSHLPGSTECGLSGGTDAGATAPASVHAIYSIQPVMAGLWTASSAAGKGILVATPYSPPLW